MEKKFHDSKFLKNKLPAIEVGQKSVSQLLSEMAKTGFQGRKIGEIVDLWEKMINDKELTIVMGYAGSLSTTGQWKIIRWLIENRYIDVLVSTGANISEDIVDAMGYPYSRGSHVVDDKELLENDVNRYYDVFGSDIEYLEMINLIADFMMTLKPDYQYTTAEFLYKCGLWLDKKNIHSIVTAAAKHKVPVFCPAIADSPYGDAALIAKRKGLNLILDQIKDFNQFMGLRNMIKENSVIYIGGGVPKDFIQLLAVSAPLMYEDKKIPNAAPGQYRESTKEFYYPHKYAIQITTDSPQWGGLSGCTFEEAASWGKEELKGNNAACYCDATIALPLIAHALNERVTKRNNPTDFSEIFKENGM